MIADDLGDEREAEPGSGRFSRDERIEDLGNVDLVIRDGRLQVQAGQVVYPRHQPRLLTPRR